MNTLLEDLQELLRFPSISTGEKNEKALQDAASWINDYIKGSGGESEIVQTKVNPIVVGKFPASKDPANAPTILIYGHYDVQALGDLSLWRTEPFEPTIKDGRIYARGASDDKGNFWPLMHVAAEMSRERTLPVNIRVLVEGEEEVGSPSTIEWILKDTETTDACIMYDSGSPDEGTPAITLGTRGMIQAKVTVTTGARDLHSGIYGGSVLNANHALSQMIAAVLPGEDGLLKDELRQGITPIPESEKRVWAKMPRPLDVFKAVGARPLTENSADNYYAQNWGDTSLDVNAVSGGEPRTVIPATAAAHITMRLAPGQKHASISSALDKMLQQAAPSGAEVDIALEGVDAAAFDPESPALKIARQAFEKVTGKQPHLIRLGATLPPLAPLFERGITTILSGFALEADAFHAPNESYRLEALELGAKTARALYEGLAHLPKQTTK